MSDKVAIKVENVSKTFKLPHERNTSIKSAVVNFSRRKSYEKQEVLKNVSFEIKDGEFFGIVGRNGGGKSTLLKLLAGIYSPDSGSIQVNGKLTPFIELGVGFNPELTGRENVYLNGALLGFNHKEVHAMYDDIVSFAELERFMDQKLKNYSSGMQVRLAFSIAIQSNSDIYLFDEVLAVGDYSFQQKCLEHFKYLKSIKKTVILVSHDANSLQMFCTSGILIEKGNIIAQGKIQDVLVEYSRTNSQNMVMKDKTEKLIEGSIDGTGGVEINNIYTLKDSKPSTVFGPNEVIKIEYDITSKIRVEEPVFGLVIQDNSGQAIFATNTLDGGYKTPTLLPGKKTKVHFEIKNVFNDGNLYISGAVASSDRAEIFVRFQRTHRFKSLGWNNTAKGMVYMPYDFKGSKS